MLRRTPCIGICSTTYGDLVCRGCKRFAHEIVQWNGFDPSQRQAVWQRLLKLRAGAVRAVVEIRDERSLRCLASSAGLATDDSDEPETVLYLLLQRLRWRSMDVTARDMGIVPAANAGGEGVSVAAPETLLAAIDREFYRRSLAQYERDYRIPAE